MVSVIVPAYNHESYVGETLDSLLNQTYKNYEILVIDDGSTDNTTNICENYAKLYPDIIRYKRQTNLGVTATVNKMLAMAQGEYIGLTASDDIWYPEKLEKQIALFQEDYDEKIGLVYTFGDHINENINRSRGDGLSLGIRGQIFKKLFCDGAFFVPCSALIRRKVFDKVGFLNPKYPYCNDYELYLKIAAYGYDFDYVPEKLVARRIHFSNLSMNQVKSIANNKEMLIAFADQNDNIIKKNGIDLGYVVAKHDRTLSKYYFINQNYGETKKILFRILFRHPSLVLKKKQYIAYLMLSFLPRKLILRIGGMSKFKKLFISR
jgi:glycosyltransferase involved in cell wall biosynthesis